MEVAVRARGAVVLVANDERTPANVPLTSRFSAPPATLKVGGPPGLNVPVTAAGVVLLMTTSPRGIPATVVSATFTRSRFTDTGTHPNTSSEQSCLTISSPPVAVTGAVTPAPVAVAANPGVTAYTTSATSVVTAGHSAESSVIDRMLTVPYWSNGGPCDRTGKGLMMPGGCSSAVDASKQPD